MGDPPVGDDHTAQSDDNGAPAVAQRLKAILASPSEPFPSFVGGQESAFQSIVSQLAAAGLPSPRSTQYPPPPPAILGNARRPDAIPEADWVPVHDQLNTELVFKEETHSLFESYYEYFTNVYVENLTYLTTTALPEVGEVGDDEGTVIVGAMISAGASAVEAAGEDIPGVGVIVGIGEAVIDKVQHGTDIPPSQLVKLGSEMGTFLSKSFNTCLAYVQTTEESVLEDWGKLEPMGRAITDQTVAWPVPDTQWIDVAVNAYRVSLWKTILPVVWDIISSDTNPELHTSTDWVAGYIEKNPNYYISCTPTSGGYSCDMFWLGRGTMVINAKSPSDDMCHEIFDNLAVPRSDVFNEWKGFARKRWMPGGGCGTPVMVAGLSRVRGDSDAVSQSLLNELRDFRDRIKPSPLGGWLVEIYNRISNPIAHIYEKDTQLKNAIAQYDGDALWAKIAGIVQGDTTRLTNNDIGNGLAIISATMQLAAEEWGDNNWVSVAIRALLPILPTYEQARSEDQLVELIAAGTPPETIEQLFAGTVKPTWDDLIGAEENDPMTGDTGPDPWEGICIHVAHMVIEKAPDIIENGFDQFGVHIKPYKTVDLPDVTNYDTNQPLTGFCGLGYDDEGNASLTLEQLVLTGLDTIQATEGQLPRFTIPDTEMVVPVTIGKQQIAGRWTMRHSCKNRQDGSTSTKAGSGGFTLSLTDTNVLLTISGLDKNTGSASAASLTWAQWETIDWAGFCAQKIPPPLDPSPKLVVTYDPDCPLSVKTTLEVYFGVEANALTQQIACNLNDLITGAIKVDGASSLADEILVAVNAFFNAI